MISITTLQGAKDILSQYPGDEYYVIKIQETSTIFKGYWVVKITDVEEVKYFYKEVYGMIIEIPEDIIHMLIDEDYLILEISEKEWKVQEALGTAPDVKKYSIKNKR